MLKKVASKGNVVVDSRRSKKKECDASRRQGIMPSIFLKRSRSREIKSLRPIKEAAAQSTATAIEEEETPPNLDMMRDTTKEDETLSKDKQLRNVEILPTADSDHFFNPARAQTMIDLLSSEYGVKDGKIGLAIAALGEATEQCYGLLSSSIYRSQKKNRTGSTFGTSSRSLVSVSTRNSVEEEDNLPGLTDLLMDCDDAVFAHVKKSEVFSVAASRVYPKEKHCSDYGEFALVFDPVDGTSIIDANFTVGASFGIWPGRSIAERTGREQVASVLAVYGPRLSLCIALTSEVRKCLPPVVFEVSLTSDGSRWEISKESIIIQERGRICSPGNIRAITSNAKYDQLFKFWMTNKYSMRYTGGMAVDIYHILAKSKGIYTYVPHGKPLAKLRVIVAFALIIELAGGEAIHDAADIPLLDMRMIDLDQRVGLCLGSAHEVEIYKQHMFTQGTYGAEVA